MKYMITIPVQTMVTYYLNADTKEEAIEKLRDGEMGIDPEISDSYWEEDQNQDNWEIEEEE
jgi:hypothetical protein